jgi:hypothetical protein
MVFIGCDFHPSWQQVSWLDRESGETGDQKLVQANSESRGPGPGHPPTRHTTINLSREFGQSPRMAVV